MKETLRPERSPQSSGAAVQYGRHMLTQLREWVLLDVNNVTIGPYRYGWGLINKEVGYCPVYNADPVAPPELLNLTFRKCKGFGLRMCENNKCTCYKNEVKCLPSICDRYTLYIVQTN